MSTIQGIAQAILPASWFQSLRASSERWQIQCTVCESERSVWSAGGIRWGAASYAKRIAVRCSNCNKTVAARVYYRDEDAPDQP